MSEAVLTSEAWPDPIDLALDPRAWLALGWPLVQVLVGSITFTLLSAGYGMAFGFVPFAVGLPMLSLMTRAAWWVAEVEAQATTRLAGLTLTDVPPPPPAQGFLLGLGDLVSLRPAWTRPLGLCLTLLLGCVGMGLVTGVFFTALGVMIFAVGGLFGFQVSTDCWVAPPVSGSAQALWFLGGVAAIVGALHLAFGWLRLHARIWQALR